uniref:Uncharacterized protein n=1 Tax=Musca domestica TaxID=7370 RepID=A0A1I8NJW2_MUSDO
MSVDNNTNNNSNSSVPSVVPQWIEANLFEEPLKLVEKDFEEILDFKVAGALAPGENYATVMLKAEFVIKLKGYSTATSVMAAVLCDPTENASIDNFVGESDAGLAFKRQMYSNPRYRKHLEAILPWLYYRGLLDF